MARGSICLDVEDPAQWNAGHEWLEANRRHLSFVSTNHGCGCCVDIYDLEGPTEVIEGIPWDFSCSTEWTREGVRRH